MIGQANLEDMDGLAPDEGLPTGGARSESSFSTATLAQNEDYETLAQFTLSLIKAMLQAGFYEPGHPEAEKAQTNLYTEFRQALEDRSEITLLLATPGGDPTIMIEGFGPAPLPLDEVMLKGMADMFAPKFQEFFDRRHLLSFSLKKAISPEEFHSFIALMSEPPRITGTGEERDRLTAAFVERDIIHISTVFDEDIVGRERRLPWLVEMAVSRLRRDLQVLPLYRRASEEELRSIKMQNIDDVIRPMRTPTLLKDFLVNCDLLAADIDGLNESCLEREIIGQIAEDLLAPTASALVEDLEELRMRSDALQAESTSGFTDRRLSVLQRLTERLRHVGGEIDHGLFESLLEQGLVTLEELPAGLSYELETRRLADDFIDRLDENLRALRGSAAATNHELVAIAERVFPELLQRRDYAAAAALAEVMQQSQRTAPERLEDGALAQAAPPRGAPTPEPEGLLEALSVSLCDATRAALPRLVEDLGQQEKEDRQHAVALLAFVGEPAGPRLIEAYADSDLKSVRLASFEAMRQIGPEALIPFLKRLPEIEKEWSGIRRIITILGEQGGAELATPIAHFLHHENAHVREAALTAVCSLSSNEAEHHCVTALRDRRPQVRAAAAAYLADLGSRDPRAMEFYSTALRADDPAVPRESDDVLVRICRALAQIGELSVDDATEAEAILLAALEPVSQSGLLGGLRKGQQRHSERVREAINDTLESVATVGC